MYHYLHRTQLSKQRSSPAPHTPLRPLRHWLKGDRSCDGRLSVKSHKPDHRETPVLDLHTAPPRLGLLGSFRRQTERIVQPRNGIAPGNSATEVVAICRRSEATTKRGCVCVRRRSVRRQRDVQLAYLPQTFLTWRRKFRRGIQRVRRR